MEIKCLDPLGINNYEIIANEKLEASLPNNWKGYSSLEMRGRQSKDFEGDLIIITHDRIINVEFKNWSGQIFANDNKWIVQFSDGREEHRSNGVRQARRSAQILSAKLKERLNNHFIPWVDYCVVLCGTATKENLPVDEKDYVFTLEEFSKIGDNKIYKQYFGKIPFAIKRKEDAPNKNIKQWDKIFSNNSVDFKAKKFSVNKFVLQGQPLFQHRDGLYTEFKSQRLDNHNYKAIMRKWDFTCPSIVEYARTSEERSLIAHRESDVLAYICNQDDDLKDIYLKQVYLPNEQSSDFVELYEWPNKKERLDTFIRKNKARLTEENRLNLIQALISRLARLHDIDVAHRDLGNHSIWVSLPSKVVLSNFLTATYPDPENKTVSNIRKILQHNQITIPEDEYQDTNGTHFTRDVYLATVACHYLAFDRPPIKEDGIFLWQHIENNQISSRLKGWFERGLDLEASARFKDLREALTELNKLINIGEPNIQGKLDLLSKYNSPKNFFLEYPNQLHIIKQIGTFHFYRANDETFGLKAWFGVDVKLSHGGVNNRLLSFFNRLDIRKNNELKCLPKILDYGFNTDIKSIFFKFEWVKGITWKQAENSNSLENSIVNIRLLLSSLNKLHSANLYHGDIHPENIIINENNLVFIDIIEFDENKYTPCYVPDNYENISKESIDRYAVLKIINELANLKQMIHLSQYTSKLLKWSEIPNSEIIKLHDQLEEIITPKGLEYVNEYKIFHSNLLSIQNKLLSDDGKYYLYFELKESNNSDFKLTITGVKHKLIIRINPETKIIIFAKLNDINHNDFIKNKKKSILTLTGEIIFSESHTGSTKKFIDTIIDSAIYQELLRNNERQKKNIIPQTKHSLPNIKKSNIIDVRNVWKALINTEHESNPRIQVSTTPQIQGDKCIFSYTNESATLDFNLNTERVFVYSGRNGELRKIGTVSDIGSNSVTIHFRSKVNIEIGDNLILEGALTASSLKKRKLAIENLINNRSIISNITNYFSPEMEIHPTEQTEPTDSELNLYTELDEDGKVIFELNTQQRNAFKDLYKYGPISLLQGPPGTGKTAFIGSFIHYCISNGDRRVLLVSQSHEAVNNATEKVRALFMRNKTTIDIVRLGDQHVLSEQLSDIGEKSLQEHYRDKFQAEYKERIAKLASEIGINEEFTHIIVEFEESFGKQIDRIISQMKDNDREITNLIINKIKILNKKLTDFFSRKANIFFELDNLELHSYRDLIYSKLAKHYEIYFEDQIYKFKNIVSISNEWLKVMASSQSQFQNFLTKTRTLVCGTCVGIARNHYGIQENIYDLVVIDEAARSSASELAIAMQVGRKILLVGDHKQLPPLFDEEHLKAAKKLLPEVSIDELKRSDFERAFVSSYGKTVGCFLKVQYRMIPAIGNLVSECFYLEEGGLETGRNTTKKMFLELFEHICTPVTWFDTSKAQMESYESKPIAKDANHKSYVNKYEAKIILELLNKLFEHSNAENVFIEDGDPKIGIICMYSEQVRHLIREINGISWARTLLENGIIKVDTIDSYQGKENDIVIVSLVRSNFKGNQGYVASENRANVALSRAKEALFIIGNTEMWKNRNETSAFGRVYKYISEHNNNGEYSIIDAQTLEE